MTINLGEVSFAELGLYLVFAVLVFMVGISVYRLHRDPQNNFNLFDLLMHNNRVDKLAVGWFVTMVVGNYVILNLTVTSRLTEGYLSIYGAIFVTPLVVRIFGPSAVRNSPLEAQHAGDNSVGEGGAQSGLALPRGGVTPAGV